jgi:hypothetical protein
MMIKEYLKTHSLNDLLSEHAVGHSFDKARTKFSLNYKRHADRSNIIARECRGLVLRLKNFKNRSNFDSKSIVSDTVVLARPFDRFFDHDHESKVDLTTAVALEKLDGTMISLYFDELKNKWCCATRSTPEADTRIHIYNFVQDYTFQELFLRALETTVTRHSKISVKQFFELLSKSYTYIFELTSELNRVVVKYTEDRVTLIGVRNNFSGRELAPENMNLPVDLPRQRHGVLLVDLLQIVNSSDPFELEGYVIRDDNFNRAKIKNSLHGTLSSEKDHCFASKRNVIAMALTGELMNKAKIFSDKEVVCYRAIQDRVDKYVAETDDTFLRLLEDSSKDKKTFAGLLLSSEKSLHSQVYFQMFNDRSSAHDAYKKIINENKMSRESLDSICRLLGI